MQLLSLLFPRRCVSCGKLGRYFCQKCTDKIDHRVPTFCPVCNRPSISGFTHDRCQTRYTLDARVSFFSYEGAVREGIKELKYHFVSDLAEELINLVPQESLSLIPKPSILVPIPLHPSRLRFRGFNQAELLGKLLAKRLNVPIKTDILSRTKKTKPQVEVKDRKRRLENMENVFSVNQLAISNQQLAIILFDDVFTTGATFRSATSVLKHAGAQKVWGLALAHGS